MTAIAPAHAAAAAGLPDMVGAMRQTCAELEAAAATARIEQDPLAPVLTGLASSLATMVALQTRIEAARQPLDAEARAEITRKLIQACRADFVRVAGLASRRAAVMAGVVVAALLLVGIGGGYLWGRSTEATAASDAADVIRAALSDGSASARVWAEAIRRNDLPGLLARCQGRLVWTEANGRRACAVPLWLDDAPPSPAPAGPRS